MSQRKSLIGSFTEPYNGFREIFFYAITFEITNSKHTLRICNFLISGFTEPYDGLFIIFFYAIAVEVAKPK